MAPLYTLLVTMSNTLLVNAVLSITVIVGVKITSVALQQQLLWINPISVILCNNVKYST